MEVSVPLAFISITIGVVISPVTLSDIVLPLSVIFSLVYVLELPHAMLFIVFPFSIVKTTVEVGRLTRSFTASILLLAYVNRAIRKDDLRDLCREWIELRF